MTIDGNENAAGPRDEPAYDVGYGRPPKEHRFKKGRSGNPRGRPKGSRNIKAVLEQALLKTQTVREGREVKKRTNIEIVLLQLLAKALKGDLKATAQLLDLCERHRILEESTDATPPLEPDDRALIEAFMKRSWASGGEAST